MTSIARNKLPLAAAISLLAILAIASVLFLSRPANVQGQANDPPAKPTGLTGTVEYDNVALSWDDPNDSTITGYEILRRNKAIDDPGVFHSVEADTGGSEQAYTDASVAASSKYVYRIKAINAHGKSPRSSYFNANTPAAPPPPEPETQDPPAQPTGLTSAVTHDSVTLSWSNPDDDSINGYRILRLNRAEDDLGDFHVHVNNTGTAAISYTDTDVEPEQRYVYRIKALNDGGESPRSGYTNADTPAAPAPAEDVQGDADENVPAAPANLFTAATHNQVLLNWSNPNDDSITGYRILRGPDADNLATLVDNTASTNTSYMDDSVESETTYVYALQAHNSSGESDRSETVEVTTSAAPEEEEPLIAAKQVAEISLVSNTGEMRNLSSKVGMLTGSEYRYATSFHTGENPDGYALSSVELLINRPNSSAIPEISIFSDSSGNVGTSLYTLTNPSPLALHTDNTTYELVTFTASNGATLVADTTYWMVAKAVNPGTEDFYRIRLTSSANEVSDDSPEWGIGDTTHRSTDGAAWVGAENQSFQMNVQGRLINPPGTVTILPEDAQVGTALTASLTDETGEVANVRWQWARSRDRKDGWTNISGATAASYTPTNPDRGEYLRATASYDDNHGSGKTASGIIKGPPALALVSNTGEISATPVSIAVNLANNKFDHATSFHTGSNPDGYALTSVQVLINRPASSTIPKVSIFSDSSGSPGTSLHTLTNPSPLPLHADFDTYELTTFTAPEGTTLSADTTYWLVLKVKDTGSTETYSVRGTESDDENSDDSPEWAIGDATYKSENNAAWSESSLRSIQMNIRGKLINPPGVVTITPDRAEVGTELMASLTDEDGGVTNVTWQWARSRSGQTGWTNISGETTNTYTPVYADRGEYLRASASYNTPGLAKNASGIIKGPAALALVNNANGNNELATIIGKPGSDIIDYATSFHTGNNPDGYALTSVQLYLNRRDSKATPEISIFSDSSGSVGASLHTLTTPSTLPIHTLNSDKYTLTTFTAPDDTTLAANTTYWLVVKAVSPDTSVKYAILTTLSDEETSDDSSEWEIANVGYIRTNGAAWAQSNNKPIQMKVQGRLINPPGVVTITPEDAEIGTELTASLESPHRGVTGVTWEWSRSSDGETGWTRISGAGTNTYTPIYVDQGQYLRARAFYDDNHGFDKAASGIIKGPPALALVSNTAEMSSGHLGVVANVGTIIFDYATSFHTGDHASGYALTSAQLLINRTISDSIPEVFIFSDSSGSVGTSLHTLTNPNTLPIHDDENTYELTTFTAPETTTLTADTTYWLVLKVVDTGSLVLYRVSATESDTETSSDSSEWEIGDVSHRSQNDAAWSQNTTRSMHLNIQGRLINPPGVITFDQPRPNIDNLLTATFTDEDGGITNLRWQWSISDDGETGWTDISGANSAAYTPVEADAGKYLRAVVTYSDNHGSGQRAEAVSQQPVFSFRIDFTIDPGMFAYEFHATEYDPLGDFRFQWKSADVTPWPTYDQFKPTHDVENFCAMPGITREGAMECGWEYVSPGSGVSSQLATLVTKHANREYDFRIVGELREGGELFSNIIREVVMPDRGLSDATERGIKAWRVDTAGHFIVEWRLTQSCDAGKQFYIRTEDSGKFAWGTGGRQHGRLLFTDNATFDEDENDEDENDVATEVFIYCATSREDTNQGHIYAAADIAAKGADPVLGTEATR